MRKGSTLVLTGAAALGALLAGSRYSPAPTQPGTAAWYATLEKPEFTPPGPVFGVAWTILDGLLWFTGYRIARAGSSGRRRLAFGAWIATLLGIPSYSYAFFGRHRADAGLAVTGTMLASSVALAGTAAKVDRHAALATAPLVGWLLFAAVLQEEVWRRNR